MQVGLEWVGAQSLSKRDLWPKPHPPALRSKRDLIRPRRWRCGCGDDEETRQEQKTLAAEDKIILTKPHSGPLSGIPTLECILADKQWCQANNDCYFTIAGHPICEREYAYMCSVR